MTDTFESNTIDVTDCDICYTARPTDIMVNLCNEKKERVCCCNISICRKCADKMQQKSCPTCRKSFYQFIYIDEVSNNKLLTLTIQPSHRVNVSENRLLTLTRQRRRTFKMRRSRHVDLSNNKLLTLTRKPSYRALQKACELSIVEDKPIMLDYWIDSLNKTVCIGVKTSGEKLLIKSCEEYTSPIETVFKSSENEYIIITSNSIYITSSDIYTRRIA